jgi:hypothetical protein
LEVRKTKSISLEKLTPMAVEMNRTDFTNRSVVAMCGWIRSASLAIDVTETVARVVRQGQKWWIQVDRI